eukprot:PhF_6_TR6891/c0_g1_i1/m.9977/K14574/SDO1, SBDS; ribosome maturation protein SDO1
MSVTFQKAKEYDAEKTSIVRVSSHGHRFEILTRSDRIREYRKQQEDIDAGVSLTGPSIHPKDVVWIKRVYENASKGHPAKKRALDEVFGVDCDIVDVILKILHEGEILINQRDRGLLKASKEEYTKALNTEVRQRLVHTYAHVPFTPEEVEAEMVTVPECSITEAVLVSPVPTEGIIIRCVSHICTTQTLLAMRLSEVIVGVVNTETSSLDGEVVFAKVQTAMTPLRNRGVALPFQVSGEGSGPSMICVLYDPFLMQGDEVIHTMERVVNVGTQRPLTIVPERNTLEWLLRIESDGRPDTVKAWRTANDQFSILTPKETVQQQQPDHSDEDPRPSGKKHIPHHHDEQLQNDGWDAISPKDLQEVCRLAGLP